MSVASFAEIVLAMRADFHTAIATPQSLPTAYPNEQFTPPATVWAQLDVLIADTQPATMGVVRTRTVGYLQISVHSNPDTGPGEGLALCDVIADRYRHAVRGGIQFRTPTIEPGRRSGPRWVTVVKCPFFAERVH